MASLIEKICPDCNKKYLGVARRIYCSMQCRGRTQSKRLIEGNLARRKYPKIEGLNRKQIYWRHNHESRQKHLDRDLEKRVKVILHLGGKCIRCGYQDNMKALCLDHINGDGKADRKEKGSRIYRYYQNHLDEAQAKLQILCCNCNAIKSFENNEYNTSRRI